MHSKILAAPNLRSCCRAALTDWAGHSQAVAMPSKGKRAKEAARLSTHSIVYLAGEKAHPEGASCSSIIKRLVVRWELQQSKTVHFTISSKVRVSESLRSLHKDNQP